MWKAIQMQSSITERDHQNAMFMPIKLVQIKAKIQMQCYLNSRSDLKKKKRSILERGGKLGKLSKRQNDEY